MTESTNPGAPVSTPEPPPAATPPTAPAQTADDKRFAVYDTVFLRFVGPTHPTRKAAEAAAKEGVKDKSVRKFQIREV